MEEPSDYLFDQYHPLRRKTGAIVPPLSVQVQVARYQKECLAPEAVDAPQISENRPSRSRSRLVNSVLLAQGIHNMVTVTDLSELPERFEPHDLRARLTWFGRLCLAGVGMFIEAYIIITTGQVKTIWYSQYPECWTPTEDQICPNNIPCCGLFPNTPLLSNGTCVPQVPEDCNADGTYPPGALCSNGAIEAISYSEFVGIMIGMVMFGTIADWIGRVRAGILTTLLMIAGVAVMTFASTPNNLTTLFMTFAVFYGVFGVGVGGEYPLTAMGAAEHDVEAKFDAEMDDDERARHRLLLNKAKTARRGETIALVFAMQGVGSVFGSAYLFFLLYFSGQLRVNCVSDEGPTNPTGNDPFALNAVWRSFYLIGGTFVLILFVYRTLVQTEGPGRAKLVARKKHRAEKLGGRGIISNWKIVQFYGSRLIGTGGSWFVMDVAFYGLKLFSGPIFMAINPQGDLIVQNGYLVVYNLCGMTGYYSAALVIDRPIIGRRRFQIASFAIQAVIFFTTAGIFNIASPQLLMFLYFLSNYTSTFGVNSTVHVMASETYPTELRGTCLGISSFSGQLGALLATVLFSYVSTQEIFLICGIVSVIGIFFTFLFTVDLTHVSLAEHDAQLELFLEGRPEAYKGRLNAPQHLSVWEKWRGTHGEYDPDWAGKLVKQETQDIKEKYSQNQRNEIHEEENSANVSGSVNASVLGSGAM